MGSGLSKSSRKLSAHDLCDTLDDLKARILEVADEDGCVRPKDLVALKVADFLPLPLVSSLNSSPLLSLPASQAPWAHPLVTGTRQEDHSSGQTSTAAGVQEKHKDELDNDVTEALLLIKASCSSLSQLNWNIALPHLEWDGINVHGGTIRSLELHTDEDATIDLHLLLPFMPSIQKLTITGNCLLRGDVNMFRKAVRLQELEAVGAGLAGQLSTFSECKMLQRLTLQRSALQGDPAELQSQMPECEVTVF